MSCSGGETEAAQGKDCGAGAVDREWLGVQALGSDDTDSNPNFNGKNRVLGSSAANQGTNNAYP